jgi:hypothetical protein
MVDRLSAELLAHDSATAVLQRWCDVHGVAPGQRIVARRVTAPEDETPAEVLAALQSAPREIVRHRRVDLACGDVVLSRADNWYRPSRLTAEMNRRLESSETPFGVVVRDLGYRRRTLSVVRPALAGGAPPLVILQHRAVLVDAGGVPFSLVIENYARDMTETRSPQP